jgi:transcriptional regulator with XRE-family HTH domain
MLKTIGKAIAAKREAIGLTQKELAEKIGCSLIFLRGVEGGERNTSVVMLRRVSGSLGVEAGTLFPVDGIKPVKPAKKTTKPKKKPAAKKTTKPKKKPAAKKTTKTSGKPAGSPAPTKES